MTAVFQSPSPVDDQALAQKARVRLRDALLIFLFATTCFTFSLGKSPLAGTEGHRAITAHQMVESGKYLIPTLYGYTYLKKPPLDYWILAEFERVLGPAEWVWRLPSALAAGAMAALLAFMTARWFDQISGLSAGIACVWLMCLWSQSRNADIDSLNTFATVGAAVCLIEIGWHRTCRRWIWAIVGAVFFGAALLLKGPACLPVVIGAIIGPAVAMQTREQLKRKENLVLLLGGLAILLIWLIPAIVVIKSQKIIPDTGGLEEAQKRMLINRLSQIGGVIALPLLVVLYGMPVTLSLIWPVHPGLRRLYAQGHRELMVALAATFTCALSIDLLSGMSNPRYAYPALPMLCPIVGAIAYGWRDGLFDSPLQVFLKRTLAVLTLALGVAYLIVIAIAYWGGVGYRVTVSMWVGAPVALVLMFVGMHAALRGRNDRAGASIILLLAALAFGFSQYKNQERYARSAYSAAQTLRDRVGAGTTVSSWYTLWAQPELFYYSGVKVNPHPLNDWDDLPKDGSWIVFFSKEWKEWREAQPQLFEKPTVLMIDQRDRQEKDQAFLTRLVREETFSP